MTILPQSDKIGYPYRLFDSVSENPLHNQRKFHIYSFIYSSNIYWAPTLFQALLSSAGKTEMERKTHALSIKGWKTDLQIVEIKDFNDVFMYKVNVEKQFYLMVRLR